MVQGYEGMPGLLGWGLRGFRGSLGLRGFRGLGFRVFKGFGFRWSGPQLLVGVFEAYI